MRTIGMIGGMSWESSAIYRMINEAVKERLGGHHSAETVMYSVDFAPTKCSKASELVPKNSMSLER